MKEQLKALYDLQHIDLRIAAARKSAAALDNGDALRRQLSGLEARHAALAEELRKSESELRDSELSLESLEAKKRAVEKKLYAGEVTNPKELSGIEKEIAMLGKNRAKLDERILGIYEIVEQKRVDANKAEDAVAEVKRRLAEVSAYYEARSGQLAEEIAWLAGQRETIAGTITDRWLLQRYETVRARYKDTGLAVVQDGKCGGCHISLTPYVVRRMKEEEGYQICESCGRILYLEGP